MKRILLTSGLSALLGLASCSGANVHTTGSGGANGNGNSGGANGGGGDNGGGSSGGYVLPDAGIAPDSANNSGPSADANCGITKIPLEKRPADLLLVLDRSGSMLMTADNSDVTPTNPDKWDATVAALDTVLMSTQDKVAWGLKMFPMGMQMACGVPDGVEVPVALNQHNTIMTSIMGNVPANGNRTPTQDAVRKATAFMQTSKSTDNKFLLLATDGQPNCGAGGGRNGNGDDVAGSVAAVGDAAKAGFPTFVVGIATSGSDADATLNMMADQGGRPRAGTTHYYPVASKDELVTALQLITGQIASCTFPLNPPPPVPENVAVEVDGVRINHDVSQMNGWNYGTGNGSIVLYGSICDKLKDGSAKDVQILYGCPGIQIN